MRSWDKKKAKYWQKFQTDSKKANTENDFLKLRERLFTETNLNHLQDVPLTKLVCQLVIKVGEKIATYTAFKDAVQSFLNNIKCDTALSDVDIKVLKNNCYMLDLKKWLWIKHPKLFLSFCQLSYSTMIMLLHVVVWRVTSPLATEINSSNLTEKNNCWLSVMVQWQTKQYTVVWVSSTIKYSLC